MTSPPAVRVGTRNQHHEDNCETEQKASPFALRSELSVVAVRPLDHSYQHQATSKCRHAPQGSAQSIQARRQVTNRNNQQGHHERKGGVYKGIEPERRPAIPVFV